MTAPRRMTATGIGQAADVSPAAARGASEGARMVRALSQGRLHDRDRVVARARRRRDRVRHAPAADRRLSRRPRHPRPQILWVRALQGHTVLGRESRFFNCLRRRFRADRHVPGVRPRVAPRAGGPRSGGPCASFKNAPDTRPKRVFGAQEAQKAFPNLSISFHFWRQFETYQLVTGARPAKVFFFPPSPEQDRPRSQIPQLFFRYAASSETMICSFAAGAGFMLHPCFRACLPKRDT